MSALSRFEGFLHELMDGRVVRLLGGELQPVEVARELGRHLERLAEIAGASQGTVPSRLQVRLNPASEADLRRLDPAIEATLASYAVEVARERDFNFGQPPRVELWADPAVLPGQVQVASAAPEDQARPPRFLLASPDVGEDGLRRQSPFDRAEARSGSSLPRARLSLLDGGAATWAVTALPFSIGRAAENDLTLTDVRVSRRHARITLEEGGFVLRDEGSRNGTQLNGAAVQSAPLHSGDRIGICGVEMVFEVEAK